MPSPFGTMSLLVDPAAGEARALDVLPPVEEALRADDIDYELITAADRSELSETAARVVSAGNRFVGVLGDDRSVNAVANGMIRDDSPLSKDVVVAVIPVGTCDFVRTFGLPEDPLRAVRHLRGDRVFPFDVGKATSEGGSMYFLNIAQAGLGGRMAHRATSSASERPSRGRSFRAFWGSVAAAKLQEVVVRIGPHTFEGRARNVVVANCQYTGGGLRLSPRSWPSDGLLDVLIFTGPRSETYTLLPQIYRGEQLPHPNIQEFKGRRVSIESEKPLPVEADGFALGSTPASFEIVRLGMRLKV